MDYPCQRREQLQRFLHQAELDAFFVSQPLHVTYLTGFTGDSSFLILTRERTILVSDHRFGIQIEQECPELETNIRGHDRTTWQAAADTLGKLGVAKVAVEARHLTLADFERLQALLPALEWQPCPDVIERLRAIKDPSELAAIRQAISIAERAFQMVWPGLREQDTEKEVADRLEMSIRHLGGQESAFPLIVAVGDHSAMAHARPGLRRLDAAPWLLVDWGAKALRYCSDLTRALPSPGWKNLSSEARQALESSWRNRYITVLQAQIAAAAAVRPGVDVREVDRAARAVIEAQGHGERFTHALGHGFGAQIHEAPSVRTNSSDLLHAGMVITLEPGIYFPGEGGVRIEDDYLVTADGCERLTNLPQDWDAWFGEA